MRIDNGPKFYFVPPRFMILTYRSKSRTSTFHVKVFEISVYFNLFVEMGHVLEQGRGLSKA